MKESNNLQPKCGYHRLAAVRRRERVSLQCVAKRLGISVREAACQEDPSSNVSLSTIYEWQKVLDVPVSELLVEPNEALAESVQTRAQLVRVMKTAMLLRQRCRQSSVERLAENLFNDLVEIMPELAEVKSLPTHGNLRSKADVPRIISQQISSNWFGYEHEVLD
ncbi:MAG: hypothetical protein KDB27_28660 [Planctomycetales bacterium]|nr:hypothetical protein [Planctomycetales bacterium]